MIEIEPVIWPPNNSNGGTNKVAMMIDESGSRGRLQSVEHRITEYGVKYTDFDGAAKIMEQEDLETATRNASKLKGLVMQRVTFITDWEPCFDTIPDAGTNA